MRKIPTSKLYFVLVLLPIIFITYLVITNGANMPYQDDWSLIGVFQSIHNHTFTFNQLWQQHNEHRIFFPNLLIVGLAQITRWNLFIQMLINIVLAAGTLGVLLYYITLSARTRLGLIVTSVLTSALVFSPMQFENWLWGWQIEWYLCIFMGVAALFLLDKRCRWLTPLWRYALAAALCFVSTFSLGNGMFFWLACFVPLVLNKYGIKKIALWTVMFSCSIALYIYKYKFLVNPYRHSGPTDYVYFFFGYIGNVMIHNIYAAAAIGFSLLSMIALLVFHATWVEKIKLRNFAFPIGLVSFVVLSDLITLHSRLSLFGIDGALASRYTAVSCLVFVALFLILVQIRTAALSWQILLVLIIPFLVGSYVYGTNQLRSHGAYFAGIETCLKSVYPTNDCLGKSYPDPNATRIWVKVMKSEHLSGF